MKLMIDISEEDYEAAKKVDALYGEWRNDVTSHSLRAIANGIPLSKGHGRLKDVDVMINKLCTHEASELFGSVVCAEILDFINDEKLIIEADKEGE